MHSPKDSDWWTDNTATIRASDPSNQNLLCNLMPFLITIQIAYMRLLYLLFLDVFHFIFFPQLLHGILFCYNYNLTSTFTYRNTTCIQINKNEIFQNKISLLNNQISRQPFLLWCTCRPISSGISWIFIYFSTQFEMNVAVLSFSFSQCFITVITLLYIRHLCSTRKTMTIFYL